ncbi:hypothetical protein AVO45_14020 [Ruegeria marisrubri]|uniref:Uncharacterized protein n=1 Tax=Ruegeria marisrubri TaxID=1685379 RepID=A0A0X3TDE5_9RHOB|nr:hypothetical protein AVO45_14020 [Ruegeria marisrubri]
MADVKRLGPTRRQVAFAVVALVVFLWPLQVISIFLLTVIALLVSYWTLGHERSAEVGEQAMGWLQARYPAAASRLRQGMARYGRAACALVERLPERWTEGLYLPDFEPPAEPPEKMQLDPFERLLKDRQKGAK